MLTCVPNACAVTDLQGNSEAQVTRNVVVEYDCALLTPVPPQQGDLKSVVLHKMSMRSTQNSYPIALGIRITGVDDSTFGQTGEAYSTIALPSMESHTALTLQEDDTALAYEFARKFPGYTADK